MCIKYYYKRTIVYIIVEDAQKNHSVIKTIAVFSSGVRRFSIVSLDWVRDFSQVACPFSISPEYLMRNVLGLNLLVFHRLILCIIKGTIS